MRVTEPIKTRGYFWLPDDPDNKLPGDLSVSERGEIRVEMLGLFSELPTAINDRLRGFVSEFDRVLGQVEDGGKVTLERCFYQPRMLSLSGGLSGSELFAEIAYIGAHFENQEDMMFSEFRFSIEGLQDWLLISGIEMDPDLENRSGSINYQLPEEILLHLPGGMELEFLFHLNFPSVSLPVTEASVSQEAFVHVKVKEQKPKEFVFSLGHKIRHFLSLALGQDVSYQSIEVFLKHCRDSARERPMPPVRVYAQFRPWTEEKPAIRWHHALFTFGDVEGRLENLLAAWLTSYETFEPVLNLYFATRHDSSQGLDVRFIQLAQGIEALHRRSNPEMKVMSEKAYEVIKAMLLQCCPPERREWLNGKLLFANEPSLRKRLRALIEPYKVLFGNANRRKSFIEKVVDTRNYFTHLTKELEGKEARGQELLTIYDKLEALFQLHLLRLIDFEDDQIDSIVRRNSRLHRKLGLKEADDPEGSLSQQP